VKRLLLLVAACSHVAPLATQPVYTTESVRVPGADALRFGVWELAELGDALYAFTDTGVTIFRGGVAIATGMEPPRAGLGQAGPITSAQWRVAVIPALDGEGKWVVAVRDGALYRVTLSGDFDRIEDRFGIHGEPVDNVQCVGKTLAIQLRNAVLVTTDGVHIQRYGLQGDLAVAANRLAVQTNGRVEVWDLEAGKRTQYAVAGTPMFVDSAKNARLLVQSKTSAWIEQDGQLHPIALPSGASIHVAGENLWAERDFKLSIWNGRRFAMIAPQPPEGLVFESSSGDLWIEPYRSSGNFRSTGELRRISTTPSNGDPAWQAQVAPVFQRVCSHCHLPGGEAGIDLSTPASWASDRDEIRRRVLVTRTMPPAGTELSDSDRAALEHYLGVK